MENEIRQWALKRLGRREYSAAELSAYLQRKGAPEVEAREVVARLVSEGLVDDRRYARMMTREQLLRGKGLRAVLMKLRQKGVQISEQECSELIQILNVEMGAPDEVERARAIIIRRYPGFREDRTIATRAFQALLRRGFSYEVARKAVSNKITDRDNEG